MESNDIEEGVSKQSLLGTGLVIVSAASFGLMAIFVKYAYAVNLNILTLLSLRFATAAAVMWLIVLWRKENYRIGRKQVLYLAGIGAVAYGLQSTFFFNAVRLTSASMAGILLYLYPVIVTLISAGLGDEKFTWRKMVSLFVSLSGLVLVVGLSLENLNMAGVLFGLGAAVVYSVYLIVGNRVLSQNNPLIVSVYIITAAALVFNIIGWTTGQVELDIGLRGWISILGLSLVSTVVAILTLFKGMKLVGPSKASIISTFEPVVTVVVAYVIFGENLLPIQLAGGVLILAAVLMIQWDG
ncbi:DMT family transporter [Phosphitispora fastidiosa]|uniref:DMT family transporter n=1 Tax=Phosphitispora fastidiosa TaxID=2837202 RepID=UPI001E5F8D07|nr:EamA family transporter [Phosphitispora fastidiosa]MBU7007936.1 drug/metabolite transporter (DMT)-like permease [Phosphitispora fastidiosa]